MMNANERLARGEGQRLPRLKTGHQRRGQAWSLGGGHPIEFGNAHTGPGERFPDHRQKISQMLPGGEFRDYTAIFGMKFDLR